MTILKNSANVIFKKINNTSIICLNRPSALNALNIDMIDEITKQLKFSKFSMFLIKGNEKAFCAGGDVRKLYDNKNDSTLKVAREFFSKEYKLNLLINNIKVPYIAFIDGIVMGGGVGLSVHGKYRVATERSTFAMPETKIGFIPDVGSSHFLSRMKTGFGMYLGLTGARLKGYDLYESGVATHFVDSCRLNNLESDLLNCDESYLSKNIEDVLNYHNVKKCGDNSSFTQQAKEIEKNFTHSTINEIYKSCENSNTEWSKKQINILNKQSPTSLHLTCRLLSLGINSSLIDCLKREYQVAIYCLQNNDFFEGVKSVLIDKTHSPIWKPANYKNVKKNEIDRYFNNLSVGEELVFDA